jgi:hypothetical protein
MWGREGDSRAMMAAVFLSAKRTESPQAGGKIARIAGKQVRCFL